MGIELDMAPHKLKAGSGDGCCLVIHRLCELSIQAKFRFKKPVIKDDGGGLEEEGEEMGGDEMEMGGDI